MIENLSATDISNHISMMRSAFKGTIVVVEGITDSRLFGKFIDDKKSMTVIAYSKDNVRRAVAECRNRGDRTVIGIMDADLDRLYGKTCKPPLFVSDKRDLESMILSSHALDDILAEYADPETLKAFEQKHGEVRDVIARAGYPLGLMMYISAREGLGLNFKDLDHSLFINRKTLGVDVGKMVDEVYGNSVSSGIGKKAMLDMISAEEEILDDPWDAVRGHDAVQILLMGLTDTFGSYNGRGMKCGQLGGALRLAFGYEYFRNTEIYRDTEEWSRKQNAGIWIIR